MSSQTDDTGPSPVPHRRYHETKRKSYGSQQAVADAWAEGAYPTHNVDSSGVAVLYTGSPSDSRFASPEVDGRRTNFYGEQEPDGSGTLWHYSTREAIRTKNGLVVSNEQCWSGGWAHCSTPDDTDARVPLSATEDFLETNDTVHDIERVVSDSESYGVGNSIAVIDGVESTFGVAFGRDHSAARGTMPFAFRVTDAEILWAESEGVSDTVDALLRPDAVSESGLSVVDSSEYRKTRLDDDEAAAHKAAGGQTTVVESRYRGSTEQNRQQYRADLRGDVIVRQGEWFFIPAPDADPAENGTAAAEDALGSHRAQRQGGAVRPVPTECDGCGGTHLEMDESGDVTCLDCGHAVDRPIYVRGQIRHVRGDHNSMNLGDVWHRAATHDRNVLTYDQSPGSGGGRRGGFD